MKKDYEKPQVKIRRYNIRTVVNASQIVYDAGVKTGVQYTLGTLDLNE